MRPQRPRRRLQASPSTPKRRLRSLATLLTVLALVAASVLSGAASVSAQDVAGADTRYDIDSVTGDTVNVTATPATIAADVGDRLTVSGTASVDALRLYLIGPRGRFLDADGTAAAVETVTVEDGAFTENYTAIDRRGRFVLLVVSPHDDGEFATTATLGEGSLPTGVTQDQARVSVLSAYSGDEVVELSLYGESPRLSVGMVGTDGVVEYGTETTVSGTSNRGDGTTVTVTLRDGADQSVVEAEADVDAAASEWSTTLNTSSLEPGSYTLDAADGVSLASAVVVVSADETVTPSETPVPGASDGETTAEAAEGDPAASASETVENASQAALENGTEGLDNATGVVEAGNETGNTTNATGNATGNATNSSASGDGETNESLPGFGVGAAVAAVAVVAVGARRLRES